MGGKRRGRRAGLSLVLAGTALLSSPALAQGEATVAPPVQAAVTQFDVRAIQVKGNRLLSPDEVEAIVYPFMGPGRTPDDIEQARAALQKAFEEKGYATVSVYIPEQSVDTGVIQLQVQPQTIGEVTVAGGTRTNAEWVLSRAPSLAPGQAPNFTDVQRDIVALNQSADRRITPEVKAGVAPGTVDVVLNVEDSAPLHGSFEFNNFSSAATTDQRLSSTIRYDDLWGRGDSISVSSQVAPERPEDGAVLSANYLARLGRAQLLGYYVHSDSNIAVVGGTSVVGKGNLAGLRYILPLSQSEGFYQSLTLGIDWKDFQENVRLGSDSDSAPIEYFPITLGWRGDWTAEGVRLNASATTVFGLRGLGDGLAVFDNKRFGAKPNFFVVKGEVGSTLDLPRDFQLVSRFTAQWSGEPLISNEGFSLGGMETVRGYYESEALGDWGAASQIDLYSPNLVGGLESGLLSDVRLRLFFDAGQTGLHRALPGQDDHVNLSSAGFGARIKFFNLLTGDVDIGAPLIDGPDSESGDVFVRFRTLGEF